MTSRTPIYQLPYAEGSDRPCDIDTVSCAFANAVEAQLDALDAIVARTSSTVPFGYAMNSGDMSYNNNIPSAFSLFFDTTLVDTDNMIDLSFDNTSIYIKTAGVYSVFYSVEMTAPSGSTTVGITPYVYTVTGSQIGNTAYFAGDIPTSPSMPLRTSGARLTNVCATGEFMASMVPGQRISCQVTVAGANVISPIHEFRLGAVWLREAL